MAQQTSFGEATLTVYLEVKKANGSIIYYKVVDEKNIEITKEEYLLNIQK